LFCDALARGKKNKPRCLVSELKVLKVDSLSSRTALHVAAAGGHVRCVRLLLAAVSGDGDR
jgi:E3 ubiquitin-protein ligase XBAT32/33